MAVAPALTQLGRYEVVRTLGQGAMGVVYEGRDPRLDRRVAIKTILKGHLLDATMAEDYSARFVREAQAVARLNHPNIVGVFDFGEQDEVAYLVMEFIQGHELAALFEAGDFLDLPRALSVMIELLQALAYAHERGIVHRDIKPANVMIDATGHVKLTDFGVARLVDSNTERTMAGTMVGTPSYMSPEQIQGLAVGSRADLFAAGVILYQFLTHKRPFTGGAFSVQKMIVHDDPAPPTHVNPALPVRFDDIVALALAKDPADRYASATAFADDLRQALQALTAQEPGAASTLTGARPPHSSDPALDPEATVMLPSATSPRSAAATVVSTLAQPRPASSASVATPARRPGWIAGAGVVALVVALVVTAVWVFTQVRHPPAPDAATVAPRVVPDSARRTDPALAPAAGLPAAASAAQPPAQVSPLTTAPKPATTQAAAAAASAAAPGEAAPSRPAPLLARKAVQQAPGGAPAAPTSKPENAPGTPKAANAATRAAAIRASASRCSDLLQRVQLGDTLSPQELDTFQKDCKR